MQEQKETSDIYKLDTFKRARFWLTIATGCLLAGVVGNILQRAIDFILGLEAISWYLLTIVFMLVGLVHFIIWAVEARKE